MAEQCVIAVDLGGTNIRAALCNRAGWILKRVKQLTHSEEGQAAVIDRIVESIQAVMPETAAAPVKAAGVACPGPLDPYTGIVLLAANLQGWRDVPLRDILRARLGLPVAIGNDANLAALGEQKYGAGRGVRDLAYVTISTGIGCGVILNDQLVLGSRGLATEVGHMVIDLASPPIHSGVLGGFEGFAAGPGIARLAQEKLRANANSNSNPNSNANRPSRMLELTGGDISAVTSKEVGEAAKLGDRMALEVVHDVAHVIGLGFVNVLHLYDPAIIIVGGSVSLMGDLLFDPVRETMNRYAMPPYRDRPIVYAQLGDDSGLLGAAALAWGQEASVEQSR